MQALPKLPQALLKATPLAMPQATPIAVPMALLTQSLGKRMGETPSLPSHTADKLDRWVLSRLLGSRQPLGLEPCSLTEFDKVWELLFLPTRPNASKARAISAWRKLALAYARMGMANGVKRAGKEIYNAV